MRFCPRSWGMFSHSSESNSQWFLGSGFRAWTCLASCARRYSLNIITLAVLSLSYINVKFSPIVNVNWGLLEGTTSFNHPVHAMCHSAIRLPPCAPYQLLKIRSVFVSMDITPEHSESSTKQRDDSLACLYNVHTSMKIVKEGTGGPENVTYTLL